MSVFDLHVHTARGSSDSSLSPVDMVSEAKRIGLDGVCLTEHSGGWDKGELDRLAKESGIVLVRALEVDTDMGHIVAFGLDGHVSGMSSAKELRRVVDRACGVMILAHPFRNLFNTPPYNVNLVFRNPDNHPRIVQEAAAHPVFELVDLVEIANGANTDEENLFAQKVARHLNLGGTAGSDAHSTNGLGSCTTIFEGDIRSESDMIEALRARAFRAGEGFHMGELKYFIE